MVEHTDAKDEERIDGGREDDRSPIIRSPNRREFLGAAAAVGALTIPTAAAKPSSRRESQWGGVAPIVDNDVEVFMTSGELARGRPERIEENLYSFAARHVDAVAATQKASVQKDGILEQFRSNLNQAKALGLKYMLTTATFGGNRHDTVPQYNAKELVEDEDKMEVLVDRVGDLIKVYSDVYPEGGRVSLFHEAPFDSDWGPGNEDQNILQYGPKIYERLHDRIKAINSDIKLCPFLRFQNLSPQGGSIIEELTDRLSDRGVAPEWMYFDFYRGYREPHYGYETANETLSSIISNTREATGGVPIFHLGEAHTINNNYTPSKQAILGDSRTALQNDVAGKGWYLRGADRNTGDIAFNPFIPTPDIESQNPNHELYNSFSGGRDRIIYGFLSLLEQTGSVTPSEQFDLWVYGHDFDYYENRLTLQNNDEEWEFINDFGRYIYSSQYSGGDRDKVTIFHGLDRGKFLNDGSMNARITAASQPVFDHSDVEPQSFRTDGSTLKQMYVMPYFGAANYLTEMEATGIIENKPTLPKYALGHKKDIDKSLSPGESLRVRVAAGKANRPTNPHPPAELVYPNNAGKLSQLAEFESGESFNPQNKFDFWVSGSDLQDGEVANNLHMRDKDGDQRFVADLSAVNDVSSEAAVFAGIDREFLANFDTISIGERSDADLDTLYAMPYFGRTNFKTASDVADLIDSQNTGSMTLREQAGYEVE